MKTEDQVLTQDVVQILEELRDGRIGVKDAVLNLLAHDVSLDIIDPDVYMVTCESDWQAFSNKSLDSTDPLEILDNKPPYFVFHLKK